MRTPRVDIAPGVALGDGGPLLVIAGPDVIESAEHARAMAAALRDLTAERGLPFVFKSSFDKANRTSVESFRGPGLDAGVEILGVISRELGVAVTTDVHEPGQAALVAEQVALLQIPAYLCRQTDLLVAAAKTGRAVNVKKGQFLAPHDTVHVVEKIRSTGNRNVILTERGSCFGYNQLVVDFRGIPRMRALGVPVCFDATHSVQIPGGAGASSGGEREFIAHLARAAVAVGSDAVFFEVHDRPDEALCDGPNQLPLESFGALLDDLIRLRRARREDPG